MPDCIPAVDGKIKLSGLGCCRCLSVSATLSGFVQFSTACGDCTCAEENRCVTTVSASVAASNSAAGCCPDPGTDCSRGFYGGPWCLCSDCVVVGEPAEHVCGNILCVGYSQSGAITADDGHHDKDCSDCGLSPDPDPFGCDTEPTCCDVDCDDLQTICEECKCGTWDCAGDPEICECNEQGCNKHNVDCPGFGCTCSQGEGQTNFQMSAALHKVEEGEENDCFEAAGYWISLWWDIEILCLAGNIFAPQSYPQTIHGPSDTGMIFFLGTGDPAGTTQTFEFSDCDLDAFNCCGLEGVNYHVEVEIPLPS